MADEITELRRRLERLTMLQRQMETRLWVLEDSRVFRILQRIGLWAELLKGRRPTSESTRREAQYRNWVRDQTRCYRDAATLAYQPRFHVAEKPECRADADYLVLMAPGGRLMPNALFDLAEAVQHEQREVLYGDEDCGSAPLFKPDWSPELLSSPAYLGRFLAVRTDVLEAGGEFRGLPELARALAGRGARFQHIPKLLASFEGPAPEFPSPRARQVDGRPLASIIICSRDAKLLKRCLDTIQRSTAYPHREIVVVEHVTGEERLLADGLYTRVRYSGRFDFATMNNLGVKAAKGDVLVFLNDDVQPLDREWLGALTAQAQRSEVGAAGALLLYPNGTLQHAGIVIGIGGYAGHPRRTKSDGGFWPWTFATRNVSAVTGACLAMRREVFAELGGFDPRFPVNYNDVDLCMRTRQAGYQVILEAAARLRHDESRTRPRLVKWEELDRLADRWGSEIARGDPYFSPNLSLLNEDCDLAEN